MNIPNEPTGEWVLFAFFAFGFFLFISGIGILKIEKITISTGIKTWLIGVLLMIGSSVFYYLERLEGELAENKVNKVVTDYESLF